MQGGQSIVSKKKRMDSYEVGYGKPPKNTQFQKGVSGNPTGRPKKALDFHSSTYERIRIAYHHQRQWTTKTYLEAPRHSQTAAQQSVDWKHLCLSNLFRSSPTSAREGRSAGRHPTERLVEYKAEDLTDDQLTEIMMTGRLRKPPIKIGKGNASNTE